MIKAVIFDMDGLMFDTELLAQDGWAYAGEKMGIPISNEVFKKTLGVNINQVGQILRDNLGDGFDFPTGRHYRYEYSANYIKEHGVPVKPGLEELLEYLEKKGYKMAVASSSEKERVTQYLKLTGVEKYFSAVVCGDMISKSKPEPDIFLKAAELLETKPEECAVLEDSPMGILAAHRAGMMPIMIPDLAEPDDMCRKTAFRIIPSLGSVREIL